VFLICSGECCSPPNGRGDLEFINLRRGKHNDSTEPAMAAPKLLPITPAPSCCCCSLNTPSFVSQNEAPWETIWECRDTKHWPISACITMSLPWRAEPIDLLKKKKNNNNNNRDQKTKNSARKQASSLVANNYKARDELRGTIDDDDDKKQCLNWSGFWCALASRRHTFLWGKRQETDMNTCLTTTSTCLNSSRPAFLAFSV